jgi:hypothetical protein
MLRDLSLADCRGKTFQDRYLGGRPIHPWHEVAKSAGVT